VRAPLQVHYGTEDYAVRGEDVDLLAARLRRVGTEVEVFVYPGATHAFYDQTIADAPPANRVAADAARPRYLAFLHRHVA
jgi:dienelactone hydrolase